ncbi:hypothetical protein [Shimia abyssi]|uniref:Outer membrane protein with beta-barrel domain n=1 Tax=Shimia abyssi TaxID=1662395 RepID=A0A2P8F8W2_9RHOB|nr:hypothetical protein [Shimia abyssi]PSL18149.1 hypothetical protein CLV88_11273 [Shimia abyssi]
MIEVMLRLISLFAILNCLVCPLAAGPWLRDHGAHFLSIAIESPVDTNQKDQAYSSLYYEYGFRPRWTLGADVGANTFGHGKSIAFLRTNIWRGEMALAAVELGLGTQATFQGKDIAIRPGASWGRSIATPVFNGWISADVTYTILPRLRRSIAKIEAVQGINIGRGHKLMLKMTAEKETANRALTTLTPALAKRLSPSTHIVTEVIFSGDLPEKLKLGFWFQF